MNDTVTEPAALDDNMPPESEAEQNTEQPIETEQVESPEVTATSDTEVSSVIEIDEKQRALNKLAFEKREEKRRADDLERRLKEIEAKVPKQQPTVESAPKLEDFDFDEEAHRTALIQFEVKKEAKAIVDGQNERQAQQRQQGIQADFNANVVKLTEKAPDYADTVAQLPQLPNETLNAIMESDNGPQLAYYLGKHLDVADQIASASPMMAAMTLGQISAQLANAKPNIKLSAAPEPVEPVNSSGSLSKSQDEMSMDEIYAID